MWLQLLSGLDWTHSQPQGVGTHTHTHTLGSKHTTFHSCRPAHQKPMLWIVEMKQNALNAPWWCVRQVFSGYRFKKNSSYALKLNWHCVALCCFNLAHTDLMIILSMNESFSIEDVWKKWKMPITIIPELKLNFSLCSSFCPTNRPRLSVTSDTKLQIFYF